MTTTNQASLDASMTRPTLAQQSLVIVGATGMVGGYALRYALDNSEVKSVTSIENYGRISLFLQKSTDRRRYLSRRQHGCRHLIEQRLKEVVIRPINDKDFRVRVPQRFCGRKPCKPGAYDHDSFHLCPKWGD
jgi:hypothetical protein